MSAIPTDQGLDDIQARADAAMEWDYIEEDIVEGGMYISRGGQWFTPADEDLEFLSKARTDIPMLVAAVKTLKEENADLKARLEK